MPDITSRQHSVVQAYRRASRGEGELVLLDGWHLLHDAAAAELELVTIATTAFPADARNAALLDRLSRQCDVFTVSTRVMDAMSPVRTPAGVIALARRRQVTLSDVLQPHPALVIVAADVQDPGNAGAIVRSAEAGGGSGVLFTGASADPWSWKALRAAMGSTFRLPVLRVSGNSWLDEIRGRLKIVATVPRGGTDLVNVNLREATAVLVGTEGAGLDPTLISAADEKLTIPMQPPVESLNVAVATALLVYEARKQRNIG